MYYDNKVHKITINKYDNTSIRKNCKKKIDWKILISYNNKFVQKTFAIAKLSSVIKFLTDAALHIWFSLIEYENFNINYFQINIQGNIHLNKLINISQHNLIIFISQKFEKTLYSTFTSGKFWLWNWPFLL